MVNVGTSDDWDTIWNKYRSETVPQESIKLLHCLAQTRSVWLLSRYIQLLSTSVSKRNCPPSICSIVLLSLSMLLLHVYTHARTHARTHTHTTICPNTDRATHTHIPCVILPFSHFVDSCSMPRTKLRCAVRTFGQFSATSVTTQWAATSCGTGPDRTGQNWSTGRTNNN